MDNLLLGFRVILPIIVYMAIGYTFRNLKTASERTFREMNKICFRSFLPIMVFYSIYQSDLKADFSMPVLIFAVVTVFVIFFASILVVRKMFPGSVNQSVLIQGFYRSNFVLFGMEVTRSICGADKMGMASILVAIIVPIFNALAVILFESYGSVKKSRLDIFKGIMKNPLIIASILGILVKLSGVTIPALLDTILSTCSKVATPMALMCLGGTFAFGRIAVYKKELLVSCLTRLVIVPAIFLSISLLLGFCGSNLVALLVMYGSPNSVSSYTMACEMGGNGELAGMNVVFTSALSVLSMFLWVVLLGNFLVV